MYDGRYYFEWAFDYSCCLTAPVQEPSQGMVLTMDRNSDLGLWEPAYDAVGDGTRSAFGFYRKFLYPLSHASFASQDGDERSCMGPYRWNHSELQRNRIYRFECLTLTVALSPDCAGDT